MSSLLRSLVTRPAVVMKSRIRTVRHEEHPDEFPLPSALIKRRQNVGKVNNSPNDGKRLRGTIAASPLELTVKRPKHVCLPAS